MIANQIIEDSGQAENANKMNAREGLMQILRLAVCSKASPADCQRSIHFVLMHLESSACLEV